MRDSREDGEGDTTAGGRRRLSSEKKGKEYRGENDDRMDEKVVLDRLEPALVSRVFIAFLQPEDYYQRSR